MPSEQRALWRNRDYMLLWSGQVVSRVGTRVSALALPLLVLGITHAPAQAGLVGALESVPSLLLSLPAGALVDRWDRKRTMILCDSGRALAMTTIPLALWFGRLALPQLYVVALVEGTLSVFFSIALSASLPHVVPPTQLTAAAAQQEALFPIGDLLGPPIGGALYGAVARAAPFVLDALSYFASVGALLAIRTPFQRERDTTAPHDLRQEIGEGVRWLWRQPAIRFLALLSSGCFFVDAGGPLAVLVLARDRGASPSTIGLLFAISAVGGLIGFAVIGIVRRRFRFAPLLAAVIWLFALVWLLAALAPNLAVLAVVTAAGYLFFSIFTSIEAGYRLGLTPDALQGRVNSAFQLIALGSYPFGMAVTGVCLQRIGPVHTLLVLFAWMLALAVMTTLTAVPHNGRALAQTPMA